MLNIITIGGRLTRDPELRFTQSQKPVISFAVACERDFAASAELPPEEAYAVFTPSLAEEWIRRAADALIRETLSLRTSGRSTLDEDAMSWERK